MRLSFFILLLLRVLFLYPQINADSISKVMVYPPLSSDSIIIVSMDRCYFDQSYMDYSDNVCGNVQDSASIKALCATLSDLKLIRTLEYSTCDLPVRLEVDSLGQLTWAVLNPPIIGQISIFTNEKIIPIWLTTEGVEIDNKEYAYSNKLKEWLKLIQMQLEDFKVDKVKLSASLK